MNKDNSTRVLLDALKSELRYHEKQIRIHQEILDMHSVCPRLYHEGAIAEAKQNVARLQWLITATEATPCQGNCDAMCTGNCLPTPSTND